jgi:hypothetical protein
MSAVSWRDVQADWNRTEVTYGGRQPVPAVAAALTVAVRLVAELRKVPPGKGKGRDR